MPRAVPLPLCSATRLVRIPVNCAVSAQFRRPAHPWLQEERLPRLQGLIRVAAGSPSLAFAVATSPLLQMCATSCLEKHVSTFGMGMSCCADVVHGCRAKASRHVGAVHQPCHVFNCHMHAGGSGTVGWLPWQAC